MDTTAYRQPAALLKAAVLLSWLVLFGLLLKRDVFIGTVDPREAAALLQAEQEEYQGIYFQEKKIGFVVNSYHPNDDRTLAVEQRAHMVLNVAGDNHPVDLHLKALLNDDGRMRDFSFSFRSPFYRMQAAGRTSGNRIAFTLSTGAATIEDSLELAAPPMLSTSRRAYLLKDGLAVGDKLRIPWFDPLSLTGKDAIIEYRGKERVLIDGRVQNLHHFVEDFSGARINSWLDNSGDVLKEESPAGFVFLKEAKFKALAESENAPELLSTVSAKMIGRMPRMEGLKTVRYRLTFPDDGLFQLNSGRQTYKAGLLEINLESLTDFTRSDRPPAPVNAKDLAATSSVQADHPKIRATAAEIVTGKTDGIAKVMALADYVFARLEKRPVLGLPDALTTLDSRRGDCNEHAVLFAALARSTGIPCRIAAGVLFMREAFYYHAWNEVLINGRWLSVDTTINQIPADLGHIKFIEGETKEQMRIGALLGQLTIEPLTADSQHDNNSKP